MINNLYIKATPTVAAVTWGSITGTLSAQTDLQSALNAKQETLVSGTNIKTINGTSVLGSGNVSVGTLFGVHSLVPMASGDVTVNTIISQTANIAQTALSIRLSPYLPAQSLTTSNLFINVSSAAAGSLCTIVIYSDANGVPTNLLYESADLDCSTTGSKTAITSFNFVAGTLYWLGLKTNATTSAKTSIFNGYPLGASAGSTFVSYQKLSITYSSAAPNPIGTIALSPAQPTMVYITKA